MLLHLWRLLFIVVLCSLLDMGFQAEVEEVVRALPATRQTMLFSATLTKDVDALAKLSLRQPTEIAADPIYGTAQHLTQEVIRVREGHERDRPAIVLSLCRRSFKQGVVIFVGRRAEAHRLSVLMELAGLSVRLVVASLLLAFLCCLSLLACLYCTGVLFVAFVHVSLLMTLCLCLFRWVNCTAI